MLRVHQARPPCLSGKSAAGYPGRPGKNHGMGIRSARRCRAGGGRLNKAAHILCGKNEQKLLPKNNQFVNTEKFEKCDSPAPTDQTRFAEPGSLICQSRNI